MTQHTPGPWDIDHTRIISLASGTAGDIICLLTDPEWFGKMLRQNRGSILLTTSNGKRAETTVLEIER